MLLDLRYDPKKIIINQTGSVAFAIQHTTNSVSVLDLRSGDSKANLSVGVAGADGPADICLAKSDTRLLVLNAESRTISVVDAAKAQFINVVSIEEYVLNHPRISFLKHGADVYFYQDYGSYSYPSFCKLSARLDRVQTSKHMDFQLTNDSIMIGVNQSLVLALSIHGLIVIDVRKDAHNFLYDFIAGIEGKPGALCLSPNGRQAFAAMNDAHSGGRGKLSIIDLKDKFVTATIEYVGQARWLRFNRRLGTVQIVLSQPASIQEYNPRTNTLNPGTFHHPPEPFSVVSGDNRRLFIISSSVPGYSQIFRYNLQE